MSDGLWQRWFGGATAGSAETAAALEAIDRLRLERPALAAPLELVREVIPLLALPPVAGRAESGRDWRTSPPSIDEKRLNEHWLEVLGVLRRRLDAAAFVTKAVRAGRLDAGRLLRRFWNGGEEAIVDSTEEAGCDPGLTVFSLRVALLPTLSSLRAIDSVSEGRERGECPACGAWPALGEYRGLEQLLYLRCGWCAGDWPFARLRCPFCLEQDHRRLGFLSVEKEEDRRRAATCDSCRRYLKIVNRLSPMNAAELLIADVETIHLDLAAGERGYRGRQSSVHQ